MSCSVYAKIFVGFKFDEVCEIVKHREEKFVTKYDENTGKPYKKDVSATTYSLKLFDKEIANDIDPESFYDIQEAIENQFEDKDITTTYGDESNPSTMLIGISMVATDDLMYGGGDEEVTISELSETIKKLKEYTDKSPSIFLSTNVSC